MSALVGVSRESPPSWVKGPEGGRRMEEGLSLSWNCGSGEQGEGTSFRFLKLLRGEDVWMRRELCFSQPRVVR